MLKIFVFLSLFCGIFSALEEFEVCENSDNGCNYGLTCDKICKEDTEAPDCFKQHLAVRRKWKEHILGAQVPSCHENGDYKPLQCVGSVCYCSDKHGVEISGFITPIHLSANKNCKCAKDKDEYHKKHLLGRFFRCNELGNFEKVQCHGSVCYCADEDGNKIEGSQTVHIKDFDKLKCE